MIATKETTDFDLCARDALGDGYKAAAQFIWDKYNPYAENTPGRRLWYRGWREFHPTGAPGEIWIAIANEKDRRPPKLRNGRKPVPVICHYPGGKTRRFESIKEAVEVTGHYDQTIRGAINGQGVTRRGMRFEWDAPRKSCGA